MKRLAIFLITIFTMFSCEDFYKDNGYIQMYEGNTESFHMIYFYNGSTKWDNVYVYSWGDAGGSNDQSMANFGGGWYHAYVKYPNVIFHSEPTSEGWGEQTHDIHVYVRYPYFTPIDVLGDKIECDSSSSKYEYSLPTYDVYFYKGELDWDYYPQIEYGSYGRGRKRMTYSSDNWYFAETIYPTVRFRSDNGVITSWVNCENYTYFVPDVYTLAVSEYSSKPDL